MKKISILLVAFLITLSFTKTGYSQEVSTQIKINQVGYYITASKIAVITGSVTTDKFYLISVTKKDTVFMGTLGSENKSAYSSTITHIADFSTFRKGGIFVLDVPGIGNSYAFGIKNNVEHEVAIAALKGYYYQRVSMALDKKYAGKWSRPMGHPDDKVLVHPSAASTARPAGTVIASPGGWYDAGDYNKYIVNSGISMGTLLSAYEDFPVYFQTLNTNIPESNNTIPDILDEVLYNLRWMLTMQDPNDGGVYNKCTNASFDGMVMPGVTTLPRYVVQKGTAATLDFAAVTAQASRIFKKYSAQLPGLSDSCLHAAESAWLWAEKNPDIEYNQNSINRLFEPKIVTGGYGDRSFSDEWFWASVELMATTKNLKYRDSVLQQANTKMSIPAWANVRMLGFYSLVRNEKSIAADMKINFADIKKRIVTFADTLIANGGNKAFQTIMGQSKADYNWGGNSNAANQGILLINAWIITQQKKYVEYALTNLDYILGRNATGYCFLTGAGSKPTMHPHHRPSIADGIEDPVPGLLAGGPNAGRQDNCKYDFVETETAYSDTDCSYASNEIAINWNAPLVYLANAIEALQQKVGFSK